MDFPNMQAATAAMADLGRSARQLATSARALQEADDRWWRERARTRRARGHFTMREELYQLGWRHVGLPTDGQHADLVKLGKRYPLPPI